MLRGVSGRSEAEADAFAAGLAPVLDDIQAEGYTTVAAITRELNRLAVPTAREGRWHRATVRKVLERLPC